MVVVVVGIVNCYCCRWCFFPSGFHLFLELRVCSSCSCSSHKCLKLHARLLIPPSLLIIPSKHHSFFLVNPFQSFPPHFTRIIYFSSFALVSYVSRSRWAPDGPARPAVWWWDFLCPRLWRVCLGAWQSCCLPAYHAALVPTRPTAHRHGRSSRTREGLKKRSSAVVGRNKGTKNRSTW